MTTESELEQSFQLGILDNIEIENGSEAYLITSKTNNTEKINICFLLRIME